MKSSFSAHEPWQNVCILKRRKEGGSSKGYINVPTLYPDGHSVNPKKVADLQKMIPFIPPQFRDFYSSLVDHPVTSSTDND